VHEPGGDSPHAEHQRRVLGRLPTLHNRLRVKRQHQAERTGGQQGNQARKPAVQALWAR
jgi:hypothetical protein